MEHVIGIIKRVFGFAKVRYRGIAKNGNRLFVAAALANLFTVRKPLLDALRALVRPKRCPEGREGPEGQDQTPDSR